MNNEEENLISNSEQEDLEFARKTYRDMLEKSVTAVDLMMSLLSDSESPRVGEVTANLIKSTADIADKLVELHKSNKELRAGSKKQELIGGGKTVNNNANFFVGTTAEVQKILSGMKIEKTIPSDPQ
jgi:hypothetical protein